MGPLKVLDDVPQELLKIISLSRAYLYSPEKHRSSICWECCSCGVSITCCVEDVEHFLSESKNMKCPECGANVKENFYLSIGVKELAPVLEAMLKNRKGSRGKFAE